MTSSDAIESYMKNNSQFIGCFGTNNLPKSIKKFPISLIINTNPTTEQGDHWLGLVLSKSKCFYFDSFGVGVMDPDIINFLKKYYKKVTINNECIQHHDSDKCGLYCVAFINNVYSKSSYERFIANFNFVHLLKNDNIVLSLL